MIQKSTAPWSEDQVRSLNEYQVSGYLHPFTCGDHFCRNELVAYQDGWKCRCGYRQNWAHEFMTNWEWKKFNPFARSTSP